jgi:hypothetical protein
MFAAERAIVPAFEHLGGLRPPFSSVIVQVARRYL